MYQPNFTISNTILTNIGIIEAAKEVITNAPLVPSWEKKFREDAIVRIVHHGTHIEGNELNLTEAAKILEVTDTKKVKEAAKKSGVVARERDIQEIINYRRAISFINDYQKFQKDLNEEENKDGKLRGIPEQVIKHLHKLTVEKILPPDECGIYRNTQVVIKNSVSGEVTFRPPPAVEIPYLIEEFITWLNDTDKNKLHPVIKAGISHYELARVHPFLDGNGRVARALTMLILYLDGYDIRKFFSLEEYYDKDAASYYAVLQKIAEDSQTDLTPWLEYFTQGLAIELNRIKEKVRNLSADLHLKKKLGGEQVFLSERQIKIVEYLQKAGFLQNQAFGTLFTMVSEDTVLREIKQLIDRGIIKKQGRTKAARYVLVK